MSSVNAVPSGVADLIQTLSAYGSPSLTSALSSTAVQSALSTAPPDDLVQLSKEAVELQQVAGLFGTSDSSGITTTAPTSQTLAQQEANDLLGSNSTTGSNNSTISLLG